MAKKKNKKKETSSQLGKKNGYLCYTCYHVHIILNVNLLQPTSLK